MEEARTYLASRFPSQYGGYFECTKKEGKAAFLNRFAVGGSIVRYRSIHPKTVEDIVALDVALPRNTIDWFESLPSDIAQKIDFTMYCGHFFCHVMYQEYLVKKGENCDTVKDAILSLLKARGAEYPAEHNVGHQYEAVDSLKNFYRKLDPTNSFNPGIGKTSLQLDWKDARHYTGEQGNSQPSSL
ncbi:lactate dehydrogenase [Phyllobacterium sp. SB3]|uniref:lactate dehydrogenase n=1 Tax=Phyllobacterium sp. SB3 TaxID=3156073 RepID=UPI0032AF60C6